MPLNRCGSVSARLSVWFSRVSAARNCVERRVERLDAAGIDVAERGLAAHHLDRGALLRAGFGEQQRAVLELQRRQDDLRAEAGFLARLAPSEAPGDHQVNHEDQRRRHRRAARRRALFACRHARTSCTVAPDSPSTGGSTVRRTNGLSSRTRLSRRPTTCARQRFDVHCDIRKFRHGPSVAQHIGSRGRLPDVLRPCGFSRWRSRSC